MKNQIYFRSILPFLPVLLLSVALLNTGCSGKNSNTKSVQQENFLEIPPLFDRTGELANAPEWSKTKEKVDELMQRITANPNDIAARLQIVTIYLSEARITGEHPYYYPSILKVLDGILILDPKNFEAHTFKASVLMSQHRFSDALKIAQAAKEINPDNAYIYGVLVDANVELGNYEEAVRMSDIMQQIKPSLESYSRASYLREIYGDYPGSIEAMILAVQAGLPGSEPYCWSRKTLGYLYEQTGEDELAEQVYKGILADRPSYAFAYEGLARVEKSRKNYTAALDYLNQASEIMPEFSFHEEMADIYALQGEASKAEAKYKEVVEMLKEDAASGHIVYLDLAKLYVKAGEYDSALVYGLKEFEARPENIDVNQVLAEIYYHQKNIEQANQSLAIALRTGSRNPELRALEKSIETALEKPGVNYIASR